MKKIVFLIAALVILAASPMGAQTFKGLELGGSVQCTHQFRERGFVNVGADLRASLPVADWARLRAVASVNGFIPNGFDRAGMAMCGVMAEARAAYVFADFGLSWNPSAKPPEIGIAFDGGVGLKVNITQRLKLFSELGIDRIGHGKQWRSTAAVKAGLLYSI